MQNPFNVFISGIRLKIVQRKYLDFKNKKALSMLFSSNSTYTNSKSPYKTFNKFFEYVFQSYVGGAMQTFNFY